ncbi:DUF4367 domain-containing protein [Cohnella hongkongensis]|uniref:DUF4367 domain-containing protein n=1 Tax=Cohnella hongkongensis TaxID=178337 RepID=A0ABV9FAD0_9BACL
MYNKTIASMIALLALASAAIAPASGAAPALSAKTAVAANSAPKSKAVEDKGFAAIQAEIDRQNAALKTGEALAYYVSDPTWNPADKIGFVARGYSFDTYADFAAKLKKLKGPAFPKPGSLPKGFKLASASVYLATPDSESDDYARLERELKKKAADGKDKVYAKRIASDKARGGMMFYEKAVGKNKRTLMISANLLSSDSDKKSEGAPVPDQKSKIVTEKVKIKGVEAVYTFKSDEVYPAALSWTDKKNKVMYRIQGQGSENKKELIAIAKSMLA